MEGRFPQRYYADREKYVKRNVQLVMLNELLRKP